MSEKTSSRSGSVESQPPSPPSRNRSQLEGKEQQGNIAAFPAVSATSSDDSTTTTVVVHGEIVEAAFIHVPFPSVLSHLKRFDGIAEWGIGIVEEAFIENALPPEEVGAVRCVNLITSPSSTDRVQLRERLVSVKLSKDGNKCTFTIAALPSAASPFPCLIHNLVMTMTVTAIATEHCATVAELSATFSCADEHDDQVASLFLSQDLFQPLLSSLNEYAMMRFYDLEALDQAGAQTEELYHAQHREFEGQLEQLSAALPSPSEHAALTASRDAYQHLYVHWVSVARKVRSLEAELTTAKQDHEAKHQVTEELEDMLEQAPFPTEEGEEGGNCSGECAAGGQLLLQKVGEEVVGPSRRRRLRRNQYAVTPANTLAGTALMAGCVLSEEELREAFDELDEIGRGVIPKDVMRRCWTSLEHYGLDDEKEKGFLEQWFQSNTKAGSTMLSYPEFAVLMLRLIRR